MRRTKRMETVSYQRGHIGRRLTAIRGWYELSQAEAAERFPGNRSQQYVSDLEQKADIDEAALQEAATAYEVSTNFIRNIKDSALGPLVVNMYDNQQAFGPYNTNHFNPLEELIKSHEENKKLFREKEELLKTILDSKEAEIKALQDRLNNN